MARVGHRARNVAIHAMIVMRCSIRVASNGESSSFESSRLAETAGKSNNSILIALTFARFPLAHPTVLSGLLKT